MEILKITDNPDGSATIDFEMNNEEQRLLIQYAVVNLLKEQIKSKEVDELIGDIKKGKVIDEKLSETGMRNTK